MRYGDAVKLEAGKKVMIKKNKVVVEVAFLDTRSEKNSVFIRCDDGLLYHHTALMLVNE